MNNNLSKSIPQFIYLNLYLFIIFAYNIIALSNDLLLP